MTRHYFQVDKLDAEQEARLKVVFQEYPASSVGVGRGSPRGSRRSDGRDIGDRGRFTPAVVEQVASEHESVDDFITALEARAGP